MTAGWDITLVLHDIRSAHNVGAILRTAESFGLQTVIVSGITPHPELPNDNRLPHVKNKMSRAIAKTALGAERNVRIEHYADLSTAIEFLRRKQKRQIIALEQAPNAMRLADYHTSEPLAVLLGNEVDGLPQAAIEMADTVLEIPMRGAKESFNVAVAAGIALYALSAA